MKLTKKQSLSILGILIVATSIIQPFSLAMAAERKNVDSVFMKSSGIEYYDPTNCLTDNSSGSYPGGDILSEDIMERLREAVEKYGELAMEMQRKYGVPWDVVFAQMVHESQMGTAGVAVNGADNNWLGIKGSGDAGSYAASTGNFAKYTSIAGSIEAWAGSKVLRSGFYDSVFHHLNPNSYNLEGFLEDMIMIYAPPSDNNDVPLYVKTTLSYINGPIKEIADSKNWPNSKELAKKENIAIGGQTPIGMSVGDSGNGSSSSGSAGSSSSGSVGRNNGEVGDFTYEGYNRQAMRNFDITSSPPNYMNGEFVEKIFEKRKSINGGNTVGLAGHGDFIVEMGKKYSINPGVFLGQSLLETGLGLTPCGGQYNFGCISNEPGASIFNGVFPSVSANNRIWIDPPTAEEGIEAWFKLIKQVYVDKGITKYGDYIDKYSPADDQTEETDGQEGFIRAMFMMIHNVIGQSLTDVGANICDTGSVGRSNGNINDTAILYAWPDKTDLNNPKPEYLEALKADFGAHRPLANYGHHEVNRGSSCDAFVAAVLRSTVDPAYQCCGCINQYNYMITNSNKYKEIPNLGNTSNMEPGDIMYVGANGTPHCHIKIFVRMPDGTEKAAQASYGQHTGNTVSPPGLSDYRGPYKIFRYIGPGA